MSKSPDDMVKDLPKTDAAARATIAISIPAAAVTAAVAVTAIPTATVASVETAARVAVSAVPNTDSNFAETENKTLFETLSIDRLNILYQEADALVRQGEHVKFNKLYTELSRKNQMDINFIIKFKYLAMWSLFSQEAFKTIVTDNFASKQSDCNSPVKLHRAQIHLFRGRSYLKLFEKDSSDANEILPSALKEFETAYFLVPTIVSGLKLKPSKLNIKDLLSKAIKFINETVMNIALQGSYSAIYLKFFDELPSLPAIATAGGGAIEARDVPVVSAAASRMGAAPVTVSLGSTKPAASVPSAAAPAPEPRVPKMAATTDMSTPHAFRTVSDLALNPALDPIRRASDLALALEPAPDSKKRKLNG